MKQNNRLYCVYLHLISKTACALLWGLMITSFRWELRNHLCKQLNTLLRTATADDSGSSLRLFTQWTSIWTKKKDRNIMLQFIHQRGTKRRPFCTNYLRHIEYQFPDVEFEARLPWQLKAVKQELIHRGQRHQPPKR